MLTEILENNLIFVQLWNMLELKKEKNEVLPNLSDHFPFNEKSMWTVKEAKKFKSNWIYTFEKGETGKPT